MTERTINTFTFPPPLSENCDPQDIATWLIRVMDKKNKSVMFASSVQAHFLKSGGISQKQFDVLANVFRRVLKAYNENRLEVQGAIVASDDGSPSNIVKFDARKLAGEA